MSEQILDDSDFEVIDVTPKPKRKPRWGLWTALAIILVAVFSLPRLIGIYVDSLWFDSLGFSPVYWYQFKLKLTLFFAFVILTFLILRGVFWLLQRSFASYAIAPRKIVLSDKQTVMFDPTPFLKPIVWLISIIFALGYGIAFSGEWETFALYFNQHSIAATDPIFNNSVSFYLFTLPVYEATSSVLIKD